ncbi:MAG: sigma-54-dependent Fis family transcriptional regulator [Bdellovibrionales bacterium]|nr:sigma-54-dependent Fis family transcriptional regulator [Bdellovibrionales bacterium]
MQGQRILIIDDEASLRTALFRTLDRKGYQVITSATVKEAETISQSDKAIDLAIVDLRLPDGDGIELMGRLRALHPNIQVIILTGHASIETAVEATRKGAFHFVTKPCNLDEIVTLVDRALSHSQLTRENQQLRTALHSKYQFDNIIGQSEAITEVLSMIERVAQSDSTVLIMGESGTGKELIAKALHYNSLRSEEAFIPINCGAIPAELLESELFGHVKGAFTGAIANRTGRFELAEEGTLFLDEIGDMSPSLQVKILRVLQERRFEPVGGTKTIESNVRVIAATNVDLELAVEEGRFREDLFYRLNVIPIRIPPLRERRSDIPLLMHHFIEMFNRTRNRQLKGITPEAMEMLVNYSWPGNIRELENLVERLSILKGAGIVDVGDLPEKYRRVQASSDPSKVDIPENGVDFNTAVDNYENALIMRALEKTGWNRNQAALLLKLNRTTLVEKIKKKGLRPPESEL